MSRIPDQKPDDPTEDERDGQTERITVELDGDLGRNGSQPRLSFTMKPSQNWTSGLFVLSARIELAERWLGAAEFKRRFWGAVFTSIA